MTSLTRNLHVLTKKFFRMQTRGLAMSFEPLNSSLLLSAPELRLRKATCDPIFMTRYPQTLLDAKDLKKSADDVIQKSFVLHVLFCTIKKSWNKKLRIFHISSGGFNASSPSPAGKLQPITVQTNWLKSPFFATHRYKPRMLYCCTKSTQPDWSRLNQLFFRYTF